MNQFADVHTWKRMNYSEKQIGVLYQYLAEIRQFLSSPFDLRDFYFIYDRCFKLFHGMPICCFEVSEHAIMRARRNFNGELFTSQYEISYFKQCPSPLSLGRFNRPKESLFYGSLPLLSKKADFTATAMAECCKDLFSDNSTESVFDFTLGLWKVKPFFAVCLCLEDRHLSSNERMRRVTAAFCSEIASRCNALTSTFILECWKFISDLSTIKDDRAHLILSAWFCAIKAIYQDDEFEVAAVVYPSSATNSSGLNIVMTPDAVDNYLCLESATMFRAKRLFSDRRHLEIYPITEIVPVCNRRFNFSNISDKRATIIS